MVKFRSSTTQKNAVTGDHKVELYDHVAKEYQDKDSYRNNLLRGLVDQVNKVSSRVADYDSGYLLVEPSTDYEVEHKLGRIPTRVVVYFSEDEKPEYSKKGVYIEQSAQMKNMNNSTLTFATPANFGGSGSGITSGYIRVMIWR